MDRKTIKLVCLLVMLGLALTSVAYAYVYETGTVIVTQTIKKAWYNQNWQYQKQITIDYTKVATNLTDFPVLININADSDLASHARSDGWDIVFTSSDKITKLNHEIETYSSSNGNLVAWVRVPNLSNLVNTVLYIYYGNPTSSNQQNSTYVWSGFQAVWHLKENPAATAPQMKDSTLNNNGTSGGSMTIGGQVAGKIDGSLVFDGTDDYISFSNSASLNITSVTVETWLKLSGSFNNQAQSNQGLVDKGPYQLFLDKSDGKLKFSLDNAAAASWSVSYDSASASTINCLAVYNGKLYAGTSSGGIVYVFDGTTWSTSYDSPENTIYSLAVYKGKLYAGTSSNGLVYVYDGSTWSTSYDSPVDSTINCLAVYNGKLYAGTSGSALVYVYDGSTWSTSYDCSESAINSLGVYNGKLYAATGTNGRLFVYDGNTWSMSYDSNTENVITSLAIYNGKLYAGTNGNGVLYIYDGTTWSMYDTPETTIESLAVYDGKIYAGTGTKGVLYVFDGTTWSTSYDSPENTIYSLAVYNGKLYAGTSSNGRVYAYGNNQVLASSKNSWDTNWHHIVTTFDGSTMKIFVDGVLDNSKSASFTLDSLKSAFLLGKDYGSQMAGGTPETTSGIFDEVRISSLARSPGWIATGYNNQNSPSTFYNIASERIR
jgi:outer membrane protein assembly factor BamB